MPLSRAQILVTSGPEQGAEKRIPSRGLTVGNTSSCDLRLSGPSAPDQCLLLTRTARGVRVAAATRATAAHWGGARVTDVEFTRTAVLEMASCRLTVLIEHELHELPISCRTTFGHAVGQSQALRRVFEQLERASGTDATVLLEGESGTGKDVLASSLHAESARHDRPFVVVDCGAIPAHLMESELFGHERGAFTGAEARRTGAFELADGGVLFLDEIGELPLELQPKLLRVLENRSFRRVGGTKTISVDVRIIAATNRRLEEAVRRQEFREDLFFRLAVVHVAVPRLADRPEDIGPLAELFFRRLTNDPSAILPEELVALLTGYHWPGNARELRNVIERFATFQTADSSLLMHARRRDLQTSSGSIDLAALDGLPYHDAKKLLLESFHTLFLKRAVVRAGGNIARAAEFLGMPRPSLSRMLRSVAIAAERRETSDPPDH